MTCEWKNAGNSEHTARCLFRAADRLDALERENLDVTSLKDPFLFVVRAVVEIKIPSCDGIAGLKPQGCVQFSTRIAYVFFETRP